MNNTTLLSLFVFCLISFTQAQTTELLNIKNDSLGINLERVEVSVTVIGNVATTVTELTFYNPYDRVLEGELLFPLADGQRVFRFAMDVNGKLREGVVVEKSLGRQAFEGVVRQQIDPGLLEMTTGNNYKARIYPIPALGRKQVLIGYEEELNSQSQDPLYQLIMAYGKVKDFKLRIEVVNQKVAPQIIENELANFQFKKWRGSFLADHKASDFWANGRLSFEIPVRLQEQVFRQSQKGKDYFYLSFHPESLPGSKTLPKRLLVAWDASRSGLQRDLAKELSLLNLYLDSIAPTEVQVMRFSNALIDTRSFSLQEIQDSLLHQYLQATHYDGGTHVGILPLDQVEADEILLFSDGLSNLGEAKIYESSAPIYTISSSNSHFGAWLEFLAERSGGAYINLAKTSLAEAAQVLSSSNYQFISALYDGRSISDVYPSGQTNLSPQETFSLAGRIQHGKTGSLELQFGRGGEVLESHKVKIPVKANAASIERLWASKNVAEMEALPGDHKEEIIALGKAYSLVTPYTSLIVLDRVEDYVTYEITPPAELKEEYDSLMASKLADTNYQLEDRIGFLLDGYQDRISWWTDNEHDAEIEKKSESNEFGAPLPAEESVPMEDGADGVPDSFDEESTPSHDSPDSQSDEEYDDSDGSFGGSDDYDDDDSGSYFGEDEEVDNSRFSEVVITSYSTPAERSNIYSVQEITAEQIGSTLDTHASNLAGNTAGVQIQHHSNSTIIIRGSRATAIGSDPLYIIDGVAVQKEDYQRLSMEEIQSINVIKDEAATSLYGSQAAEGVILITTKGNDEALPDSVSQFLDPSLIVNEWEIDAPYMDSLKAAPGENRYSVYLRLSETYASTPSFFLSTGLWFIDQKEEELGFRILSNLAELELENHEILKMLAHSYRQKGRYESSIFLYERIIEIRDEEIHSYRDLALAYEAKGDMQLALDTYLDILLKDSQYYDDRFPYLKATILMEMNSLMAREEKQLDFSKVPDSLRIDLPVDIRIVLDWNVLETDIDLWVTEPNGETCYYSNDLTQFGGRLTEDYTDGYGPEEYLLKKATPGEYKIQVDYYDERTQKISGPITIQVSIFTNYGSKNQRVQEFIMQLEGEEDIITVGTFTWE